MRPIVVELDPAVAVADVFRRTAQWRDLKAEEYPEDARNAQSAAALRDLAEYVRGSIPDDPRVLFLAAQRQHQLDGITVGPDAQEFLSRYGFDRAESHLAFLSELCVLVARDVLNLVAEGVLTFDAAADLYAVEATTAAEAGDLGIAPYPHELAEYGDPEFLRDLLAEPVPA